MSGSPADRWRHAVELHEIDTAALVAAASAVAPERWILPLAPGKWSPAEVVEHLCLTYEVLQSELGGAPGMALRTRGWQRLLLRWTLRPRLIAGASFPAGVRSPREVRPAAPAPDPERGVARFTLCARRFLAAAEDAHTHRPNTRLTHAYLGPMPLWEAVQFSAVHVRHHRSQLTG